MSDFNEYPKHLGIAIVKEHGVSSINDAQGNLVGVEHHPGLLVVGDLKEQWNITFRCQNEDGTDRELTELTLTNTVNGLVWKGTFSEMIYKLRICNAR